MAKAKKIFVLPDLQIPYHNARQVNVALQVIKDWQPDFLVIIGDFLDLDAMSRFSAGTPEEWEHRLEAGSAQDGLDVITKIRNVTEGKIIYTAGNHEARCKAYIDKNAPALSGYVTVPKLLNLEELEIDYYEYSHPPVHVYNGVHAHHGTYVSKHPGRSAESELNKYGVSGVSGHVHRIGHYRKTLLDREIEWWECGHLSDPKKQDYEAWHNWQAGWVYTYCEPGGRNFFFPATFAQGGNVIWHDGQRYVG